MTFKKSLKIKSSQKGQSALEYFIISAVVASVVWWGFLGSFKMDGTRDGKDAPLGKIQAILQGRLFQKAVGVDGLNVGNE